MRLLAWLGGFLVVAAIVSTAGVVAYAHQHASSQRVLAAARQPVTLDVCCPNDPTVAAPHRPFHPSPSPTPPPATSAPAPAGPAAPPRPALIVNSTQQALINQDRARYGLPPLTWSTCLFSIARAQAAHLATPGVTFQHYGGAQQDLGCQLGYQAGENIGWWSLGVNDPQLNTMFMNSPDHRANILGPYRYVATAWAVAPNGYGYIAVEFG